MLLVSFVILIIGLTAVSATDSDNTATTDNSGSDVAVDSSSSTSQATDTSTHTDSSVDKTSDTSVSSSQKTDTTSQSTTQKVSEKTSENTQTTSDTTAKTTSSDTTSKVSSDTASQSTQSTSQSTQQVQSDSNTTNENTNTVNEKTVDTTKSISTEDIGDYDDTPVVYNITSSNIDNLDNIIESASDGDTINFEGVFQDLTITCKHNLNYTSLSSAYFTDTLIRCDSGSDGSSFNNLVINNTDTTRTEIFHAEGINYLNIYNNTFIVNTTSQDSGVITLKNCDSATINGNNIVLSAVTKDIIFYGNNDGSIYEGTDTTYGIGVFNSSYVDIRNNNISVSNSIASTDEYTTISGIIIQGSQLNFNIVINPTIFRNNITIKNDKYAYAISVHYNVKGSRIVSNNIKSADSSGAAVYGIELSQRIVDSDIQTNNINLSSSTLAYGITAMGSGLTNVSSLSMYNNFINVTSDNARGLELFFTNGSQIQYNTFYVNGKYTNAIGVGGTVNSILIGNNITSKGTSIDQSGEMEDIPFITSGIYVIEGSSYVNESLTVYQDSNYNNITSNNIYSLGEYSINLTGNYNNIKNNKVSSNITKSIKTGDDSMLINGNGNTCSNNTASTLTGKYEEDFEESQALIINQDNYEDFFNKPINDTTYAGLSDLVNDGDVLDIQGEINIDYTISIDKAVNITSTTNDGVFTQNDSDRNRKIVITEGGSNTNVTNITVKDLDFFTITAHNITIDNINVTCNGLSNLGEETGIFSMRDNTTNITITNSNFYTENNGGHSTVVMAGASYVTFINNTITGVGEVGNLFYMTSYDLDFNASLTDDLNDHVQFINNTLTGPDNALAICDAFSIAGTDVYMANNIINYTGNGITVQYGGGASGNFTILNNTLIGTGIISDGASVINNTAEYINASSNGDNDILLVSGNNVKVLEVTGSNFIVANNTIDNNVTVIINATDSIVENNTLTGSDTRLNIIGSNNIIENNTMCIISNTPYLISLYPLIIINGTDNNTVRYNDLISYDMFRNGYAVGDNCVYVTEGTTGNIVQDNYGNVSSIELPTDETNYTYITKDVTSMEELISALDDIETNGTYSEDTRYVINLLEGDYTITEAITWGNGTGDVKELIINGTNQTINGNGFSSTFLNINSGYSLILNNLTISNFTLVNTISNRGNLTIENCVLDNAGIINSLSGSKVLINNTDITQSAIRSREEVETRVMNSNIHDVNLSSMYMAVITISGGNLTFYNNSVSNITAMYFIQARTGTITLEVSPQLVFEENTLIDLNCSSSDIYVATNYHADSECVGGDFNTFINNTFINGCSIRYNDESRNTVPRIILNNTYINCSLPVNITGIQNTTITTEDYTTTVTVSANSTYGANVDGQVIISIDGVEYKTFDVVNGKANITIENSALNLADNNIEVKYVSPNNGFENTTETFTITLAEDMIIRIPEGTLYSGDTIALTTQVAVNGSIAKDGYVIFKVNGKTLRDENGNPIMIQVDENGIASLNYTIPDTYSNQYNITAVYSGSEGIVRSSTTLTTSLKTANITVEPITAKAGQTVTLTAFIKDQNGNAVNTGKLIFKLNGKTLKDANGNTLYATINNGVATLVYTIPDNYSAKDYILTAVYQGTGFERSEANSTLTLTKSTPTIVPDSTVFGTNNTITINQGQESVNIKATIIDPETNAPIDTTTVVTIKINDKTVTQQYVSNGQIDMTIYTSSFKNPTYNITVVVGENSQYARTSFNGTLEIVSPAGLATGSSYNGTLLVKED